MNRLAEILLKKSFDECSVQELQHMTQQYPFFNAGHLLVVKKAKKENSGQLPELLQKAALHFHPLYLNSFLNNTGEGKIIFKEAEVSVMSPENNLKTEETNLPESFSANINSEPEVLNKVVSEITPIDLPHESITAEPELNEPTEETALPEIENATDEQRAPETVATEPELPALNTQILKQLTSSQTQDTGLSFEPYHTVDYFASQGIKIKLEENAKDKFTQQLRSFTEWLKAMKKLPDAEVALPSNPVIEQKVEQLAEISLTDSTVVTEAMAEVWAKQGNAEKAIEIYTKLSLLEPAKSPYFASLISDLKKTN